MISPEELAAMRRRAEHPPTPLIGALGIYNSDTSCDWCRGQGRGEDACYVEATHWLVLGHHGAYHPACAEGLGWLPHEEEARLLTENPRGPYG